MSKKMLKYFLVFTLVFNSSMFAQTKISGNNKILSENTKTTPIKLKIDINNMMISTDGSVIIPSLKNTTYKIKTSYIESELISERVKFLNEAESIVIFQLTSLSPKTYELLYVYNLLSVDDYKKAIGKTDDKPKEKSEEPIKPKKIIKSENVSNINKLELANQYRRDGKFIHALSIYRDVILASEDDEDQTAFFSWKSLINNISLGYSLNSYEDDFEVYEHWYNLLNEFEDLWFEECPVVLHVTDLKKGNMELGSGTVTYTFNLESSWSVKYKTILESLQKGVKKARKDSWSQIPESWPKYSCRDKKNLPDMNRYFESPENGKYVSYATFNKQEFGIIYSLYSLDGTPICKNETAFVNNRNNEIKNVDRKLAKFIDKGEVNFVVEKIITRKLPYRYNYVSDGGRNPRWEPSTSSSNQWEVIDLFEYNDFIVNTPFDTPRVDYDVDEIQLIVQESFIEDKNLYILSSEVNQELYYLVTNTNPSEFKGSNMPVTNINFYDAICFCNKLSDLYKLTPVYSVNGETNIFKWPVKPFKKWPADGNIVINQNPKANGFRLPSVDEWKFAANRGNSIIYKTKEELEKVAVTSTVRKKDSPSNCMNKKPNEFNLYDMFGNVSEMAVDSLKTELSLFIDPNFNKWTDESNTLRISFLGGCYNTIFFTGKFNEGGFYQDYFYSDSNFAGFRIVRNRDENW